MKFTFGMAAAVVQAGKQLLWPTRNEVEYYMASRKAKRERELNAEIVESLQTAFDSEPASVQAKFLAFRKRHWIIP